jgi:endonuclease/exonuclease/phosphatase (EEP) superfamily protein YafD
VIYRKCLDSAIRSGRIGAIVSGVSTPGKAPTGGPRGVLVLAIPVALVLLTLAHGFPLLALHAHMLGIPEIALRLVAVTLVASVAGSVGVLLLRRPLWGTAFALVLVVFLSFATFAGCLSNAPWWLEIFSHFRLQYGAGLLLGVVYFSVSRKSFAALAAAVVASVNLYFAAPQLLARPTVHAGSGRTLRLATANLHKRNEDAAKVLDFVRQEAPDVLFFEEFTSEWQSKLRSLDGAYPHAIFAPQEGGVAGVAVLSRLPLRSRETLLLAGEGFPSIEVEVEVAGRTLRLLAVHPPAPRNARLFRIRNRIYAALSEIARESSEPVVVAGDFNSTPWAYSFRRLLEDGGLEDTSEGRGFQWSWPAGFWPLAIPIDHCLVRGVRAVNRHMGSDIGSDHYPLVVDLSFDD